MTLGLVVVVVDDEPDLRQLLCAILEDEGFVVVSLEHPSLALLLEESQKPTVFLLDLMLPGMTGIELAQQLQEGPFSDVARVAFSASPFMLQQAAASKLFHATLKKPFDIDQLVDILRRYVA